MTPIAITFFIIGATLVRGGLIVSITYLVRHNRARKHSNGPEVL